MELTADYVKAVLQAQVRTSTRDHDAPRPQDDAVVGLDDLDGGRLVDASRQRVGIAGRDVEGRCDR